MSKADDYILENMESGLITGWDDKNRPICQSWLTPDQALKAVEIAREEVLEYVKYQLDLRLPETLDYNGIQVNREDFINDFIKAIKDE